MRTLDVGSIPTSLGEIINYKYHLDLIKSKYDQIKLSFNMNLLKEGLYTETPSWAQREIQWKKYLEDIGKLFFSESPYVLQQHSSIFRGDLSGLLKFINIPVQKPNLSQYLCKGLAINTSPYIVLTTKVREMERPSPMHDMYEILQRHNVVILGERIVEIRKEYVRYGTPVFGIYDEIINNIPKNKIIDLTVAALGETASNLSQIQQDCFIMKNAKYVVTLGIGGNLNMATASGANIIGYRTDNNRLADIMYQEETVNFAVTKDRNKFISLLKANL